MRLSNSEFYLDKKFDRLSTGLEYFFFNKNIYFKPHYTKNIYNNLFKTNVKYKLDENLMVGLQNSFKFGKTPSGDKASEFKYMKVKLEYSNECAIIGLAIKKELGKNGLEVKASSWNVYFKIPEIK